MKEELELELVRKYPTIFRDYRGDMRQTCMAWGMECGDGWYNLIDKLCSDLEQLGVEVVATQVKEKYGTLRFYCTVAGEKADEAWDLINKAEDDSAKICEVCGKKGRLYGGGWYATRCKLHKDS